MNTQGRGQITRILKPLGGGVAAVGLLMIGGVSARASVAYGTINNFDTVNDTGVDTSLVLQQTADFSFATWAPAPEAATVVGASNRVTISPLVGYRFYRLLRP